MRLARASADRPSAIQMAIGMKKKSSWLVTAACLALPLAAVAQADTAGPRPPGPAPKYESAFADYKPWQDVRPGNWRALNDAVRGTPAGHADDGAAPKDATAPAPASPAARPPAPAAGPGAAHHMQEGHK